MDRKMLLSEILNVLNLDENMVGEHTLLEDIEFDSIAKLGVISVIDTFLEKVIDAALLNECITIGDVVDLAYREN
jgi:hypothetical protein